MAHSKIAVNKLMMNACVCAHSLQSCLAVCDPLDCSPPSSSVQGILQARILEWVAMPYCPPAMQDTQIQLKGQEDPLEKEMATDSSIFAW